MKIKLKSTLYFDGLFDLEIAIEIRQVHKRFIKLPITILYKVFGLKISLYLKGSCLFRLYFDFVSS